MADGILAVDKDKLTQAVLTASATEPSTSAEESPLGSVVVRGGATHASFDGRWITSTLAREIAACEGDELVAYAPIPEAWPEIYWGIDAETLDGPWVEHEMGLVVTGGEPNSIVALLISDTGTHVPCTYCGYPILARATISWTSTNEVDRTNGTSQTFTFQLEVRGTRTPGCRVVGTAVLTTYGTLSESGHEKIGHRNFPYQLSIYNHDGALILETATTTQHIWTDGTCVGDSNAYAIAADWAIYIYLAAAVRDPDVFPLFPPRGRWLQDVVRVSAIALDVIAREFFADACEDAEKVWDAEI